MEKKIRIFKNREIPDLPFPEITSHTHDGINSPVLAPQSIDSVQIKTGAVGELALEDDAVTKEKIADDAVWTEHLHALVVTKEKIAAAAVEWDKIANEAVKANNIWTGGAVITLSAQIKELIVQTGHIQDLAVEWAKIGNLAVGNSKIMNEAVGTSKIQDLAVNEAKIDDLAVSSAKIQDLAVTNAKIASLSAGKITAGQFNLTSTGYLSCPYGGIKIGYLGQIGGVNIYGIGADIGHGIMLNAGGSDGYSRLWIDDSANKPLCLDCNAKDRFFVKAASGNDIVRFYGNNAWSGGFIDMLVPFRPQVLSGVCPSSPVQGEIYYDSNPGGGMGAGGRLGVWNGYSWHYIAWFDDI
jgi:hypothetical protein